MNTSKRTAIVFLLVFTAVLSQAAGDTHEVQGRDVAREGILKTFSGVLLHIDTEWYVESEGIRYEMHMGQLGDHADQILIHGVNATLRSFVLGMDMAPIAIEMDGIVLRIWNEDRTPSWAGQGSRRNAQSDGTAIGFYGANEGKNLGSTGDECDCDECDSATH